MAPESTSTSTVTGQTVQVARPATGETLNITSVPGGNIEFSFDPATSTITRAGNDLVLDVDGGGTVRLTDFFVVGDQSLPSLTLPDGASVASADFLANFDIELATAAGPGAGAAGAAGSGAGEYADDAGALIDGIDRLGSLGTMQWGYESEVPEEFAGLAALDDAGVTLPGGAPEGPEQPEEPEPEPEPNTEIHAHDNAGVITREGAPKPIDDSGGKTYDPADYKPGEIVGKWHTEQVFVDGGHTGEKTGLTTKGGNEQHFNDNFSKFWPAGTFAEAVREDIPGFKEWSPSGTNAGGLVQSVELGDTGTIEIPYSMYSTNNNPSGADACYFVLFKVTVVDGQTVYEKTEFSYSKVFDQGTKQPILGEKVVWNGVPKGDYVVMAFVVENGNSGQKPVLTYETNTSWGEITYEYDYLAKGNVITDYLMAPEDTPRAGSDHDNLRDHATEGYVLSVTGFSVNGGELQPVGGEPVRWELEDGTKFEFTMDADGNYTLTINGAKSDAYSLDDLNITYSLQGEHPNPPEGYPAIIGGDDTTATLYIRSADHIFDESDTVEGVTINGTNGNDVIFGGAGDDTIYAGDGDNVIYGGQGDDTIYAGDSEDIFAWTLADMDGSTDTIIDFEFGTDKLRFEDFFGTDQPDVNDILAKLGAQDANQRLEILSADELAMSLKVGDLTVEINFDGSGLTADQVMLANSSESADQAAQAALLATLFG